jgi:hypothetical protein
MQEVEVTFGRAARIWWAWLWRTVLATVLISAVFGLTIGMLERLMPGSLIMLPGSILRLGRFTGIAFACLIGIGMMRHVLRRSFGGFRIALIKQQNYFSEPF